MEIAQNLKATLAALQAIQRLLSFKAETHGFSVKSETLPDPDAASAAVQDLLEAASSDAGKRAVVTALTCAPGGMASLLRIVKVSAALFNSFLPSFPCFCIDEGRLSSTHNCSSLDEIDCGFPSSTKVSHSWPSTVDLVMAFKPLA